MDSTKDDPGGHSFEFEDRWHSLFTTEELWSGSEEAWAAFHILFFDVIESALARATSDNETLRRAHNPGAPAGRAEFSDFLRQKIVTTRWAYRGRESVSELALAAAREFVALKLREVKSLEKQKRWHRKFTDEDLWRDCGDAWHAFYERYLDEFENAVGYAFRILTGKPMLRGNPELDDLVPEFLVYFHDMVVKKKWAYRGETARFSYMFLAARNFLKEKARRDAALRLLAERLLEMYRRDRSDSENREESGNASKARGADGRRKERLDRKALLACLLKIACLDRQLLMKRSETASHRLLPYAKVAEAFRMDADVVRERCRNAVRQIKDCVRRNSRGG